MPRRHWTIVKGTPILEKKEEVERIEEEREEGVLPDNRGLRSPKEGAATKASIRIYMLMFVI